MKLFELVLDHVSMGYTIEFRREPLNLAIKVSIPVTWQSEDLTKESWLPLADHCNEERVMGAINFGIEYLDKVIETYKNK